MNASEYMKQLAEIDQSYANEIGKDCLEDVQEEENDNLIKENNINNKKNSGKDKIE